MDSSSPPLNFSCMALRFAMAFNVALLLVEPRLEYSALVTVPDSFT
jgi:hypothetical protein